MLNHITPKDMDGYLRNVKGIDQLACDALDYILDTGIADTIVTAAILNSVFNAEIGTVVLDEETGECISQVRDNILNRIKDIVTALGYNNRQVSPEDIKWLREKIKIASFER